MFCSNCGEKNSTKTKYCSNCGHKAGTDDGNIEGQQKALAGLFKGRVNRINFTCSYSLLFAINITLGVMMPEDASMLAWAVAFLWVIFSVIIFLSVTIRRWHDMNKSGWNTSLFIIPYIGWLAILWLAVGKPVNKDNQFGAPDKSVLNLRKILGRG
jgi:uncharacterized membrane protein YhaH (DUF805 family)